MKARPFQSIEKNAHHCQMVQLKKEWAHLPDKGVTTQAPEAEETLEKIYIPYF